MKTVVVGCSRAYPVMIGAGLLSEVGERCREMLSGKKCYLVSDSHVAPLYLDTVCTSLSEAGFVISGVSVVQAGEESKNFRELGELLEAMAKAGLTREDTVFALGGGVVGDLAGLAAALCLRGVGLVQLPTSLLAMVDSSVGGKTAVDLSAGKNLAGAFYQPLAVFCDIDALGSLPEEYFTDGLGEVAKYALLTGEPLWSLLQGGVKENLEENIFRCVDAKRRFVEEDEFDRGRRQFLNLGHTVGHAVETLSGYTVSHGKAVAIGTMAAARLAFAEGFCGKDLPEQVGTLLEKLGLNAECPFTAKELVAPILHDKKRKDGNVRFVLPKQIGECAVRDIPEKDLLSFLERGGL